MLIHLAAEGIVEVLGGCAGALAQGAREDGKGSKPGAQRGIDYFGPHIIKRWLHELGPQARAEQLAILTGLAAMRPAESGRAAATAIKQVAPKTSSEDQAIAVEYLTAIPLSVRRAMVPDPATGCMTLPPTLSTDIEGSFLRLLPADVPPFPIDTVLPGTSYQLEELVGLGGFGAVYRARNRFEQNQPPRAIKFCLDSAMVPTLYREQAILDRLMTVGGTSWSNRIVRLYGYALDVQPPFLVYEFVPGGDLTSHLTAVRQKSGRGFRPAVVLELIRQVAEALAFAHEQGLVHRDLKPANILVSGQTIKLTDFGIGSVVATHAARGGAVGGSVPTLASVTNQALFRGSGTPLYMSPEQRRGDNPDPRHDLYSLGVVWYQLLVGDVTCELHPGWPDELTEEFQTPVEQIELIQRCVGYYKKRPANAGQLLTLLPPKAGEGVRGQGSGVRAGLKGQGPGNLSADLRSLASSFDQLQSRLAEQIDHDEFVEARLTVQAMLRLRPGDPGALDALSFVNSHLGLGRGREIACLREHEAWVRSVALTADGRRGLSGGDDGTLRLWDLDERRTLRRLSGHSAAVMSVALTPDGRRAISGGWDGTIRLWDLAGGVLLHTFTGDWQRSKCVAIGTDGRRALWGGEDRRLRYWDLEKRTELHSFDGHTDEIQSVALSPDGPFAVSGGDDATVRLWDLEGGQELRCFTGHSDAVLCVALAPDGHSIFSGSSDNTLRQWDVESGQEVRHFQGHTNWINSVAVTADGSRLLSGSGGEVKDGRFQDGDDKTLRLWEVTGRRELARLEGHKAPVTTVALSYDGRRALSGSLDKTLRLWELPG
jgi:serine/threonine protein kinase